VGNEKVQGGINAEKKGRGGEGRSAEGRTRRDNMVKATPGLAEEIGSTRIEEGGQRKRVTNMLWGSAFLEPFKGRAEGG